MTAIEFYQYLIHFAVMLTVMTVMGIYLLVSRRNAFGREIVGDQRLRRKAGWMIVVYVLIYLANVPIVLLLGDDTQLAKVLSVTLDTALCFPVVLRFLFELLQDRRRWDSRLWWLSAVAMVPMAGYLLTGQAWWTWAAIALNVGEQTAFIVWYVCATIAYNRFLTDNYADLEHKQIMWSWIMLCSMGISVINYMLALVQSDIYDASSYSYIFHFTDTIFIGIIVWHIDHQQVLEPLAAEDTAMEDMAAEDVEGADTEDAEGMEAEPAEDMEAESAAAESTPPAMSGREQIIIERMAMLLRKHCEEAQLYLEHDLSLNAVARACSTNRTYLGMYFASQGITYYIYVNKLRIAHFQARYREALNMKNTPPTIRQLSLDSGFASYNTFSRAFVSCTGMTVSQWVEQEKAVPRGR